MIDLLLRRFVPGYQDTQDPAVRQGYGTLSGGVGILLNLLLFTGKFLAGLLTASIAITADAFNNLSDAGSSIVTLVGFRLAGQKPDAEHPFGHGRMEYLSGLMISLVILLVGVELAKSSLEKLLHPEAVTFSPLSVVILLAAICVKLWMFWFNRGLSRRIESAALSATATDSLSDAVATTVVLLCTLIDHFFQVNIDGAAGLLVAVFILRAGWQAVKDTLDPLLGKAPDPALVDAVQREVLSHAEIIGTHDMIFHDYGPGRIFLSLHAEVPADCDIMAAHDAVDAVEQELKERYHLHAVIHMDPVATDEASLELRHQVVQMVREIHPDLTIHDFRMTSGPRRTNLIFDLVVPFRFPMEDGPLRALVEQRAKALSPTYHTVVEIDHAYTDSHPARG
jgi:cation diffusion facilitator family transporter